MRIRPALLSLVLILLFIFTGCQYDMDLRNDNEPDTKRILVAPEDVELMIRDCFRYYWFAWNGYYPSWALSTMADEQSSSWG
ncbi:hypothetical protein ACFL6G_06520 [candidate division KSB1 bacterium]